MSFFDLPEHLPVPEDDGACDHLRGRRVPPLPLSATDGTQVDLSTLGGRTVLYVYPMTGTPGVALPEGWDEVPGARGCTPQACAFRDYKGELDALGARVFGLSAQRTDAQREAAERLHLPYRLLSDEGFRFAGALELPTFTLHGQRFLRRVTLILEDSLIEKVFYPVFPPNENAAEVVRYLRSRYSLRNLAARG